MLGGELRVSVAKCRKRWAIYSSRHRKIHSEALFRQKDWNNIHIEIPGVTAGL
jgi:hypothetical protein